MTASCPWIYLHGYKHLCLIPYCVALRLGQARNWHDDHRLLHLSARRVPGQYSDFIILFICERSVPCDWLRQGEHVWVLVYTIKVVLKV